MQRAKTCNTPNPTPAISGTGIARCTIIRHNLITENDNLSAPANASTEGAPWGVGVELPGDYADLIEENTISNNPNNGVLGFEYPNPFPPTERDALLPDGREQDRGQHVHQQRLQRCLICQ